MSDKTGIAWTDATWNPVTGCSKVSAGCTHCYAEREWPRLSAPGRSGSSVYQGRKFTDVRCHPERLNQPLRWRRPRRIFVNSMSDLFHEDVPTEFILDALGVMGLARRHTFQILTKRPERARAILSQPCDLSMRPGTFAFVWPLPNVWLGVSTENQAAADERIPHLLATPAAVRFVSCEPLLGATAIPDGLDWVIVGGESGPKARPLWVPQVRYMVKRCASIEIPCFVKQLGANVQDRNDAGWDGCEPTDWPDHIFGEDRIEHIEEGYQGAPVRVRTRDRAGADPSEWPEDLRVRQMPDLANFRSS